MGIRQELELVAKLAGVAPGEIELYDSGFLSRGYVIDGGRIVFKFPKYDFVKYDNEAKVVNYLNTLDLGVGLQRVRYLSEDCKVIGFDGVRGTPLSELALSTGQKWQVAKVLAAYLKKLHAVKMQTDVVKPPSVMIAQWQEEYNNSKDFFAEHFTKEECAEIDRLMMSHMPSALENLGENLVFCHSDFAEHNIFIDANGEVGVIDFDGSGYYDEAIDFFVLKDDALLDMVLDEYKASDTLRRKADLTSTIRTFAYVKNISEQQGESAKQYFIQKIRRRLQGSEIVK